MMSFKGDAPVQEQDIRRLTQLVEAEETIRLPRGYVMPEIPEAREKKEIYASFRGEAASGKGGTAPQMS